MVEDAPSKAKSSLNGAMFLVRVMASVIPLLLVGMVTLLIWVVEMRSDRYTSKDHAMHMQYHAETIPGREVLDRLARIEVKLDRLEELNKNNGRAD